MYFLPFIKSVSDKAEAGFLGIKTFKVYKRYSMFQAAIGVKSKITNTSWGIKNPFGQYTAEYDFKIGAIMFLLLLIPVLMYFVHRLYEKRVEKKLLKINMGLGIGYLWLFHYVVTRCNESYAITFIGDLVVVIVLAHIIRNFMCLEGIKDIKIKKERSREDHE